MVKKQTIVVLVAFLSLISSAFGLGLGDIKVNSNLNDPLDAEIQLIQLQGLTSSEILPTLASSDDFKRAGIERTFFLANIQLLVKEDKSGNLVISLTTSQAVREPFLNFLVEVNWPGGRLLKEYTILLDPPVFDTGLAVDALVVEPTQSQSLNEETDLVTATVVNQKPVQQETVVSQPIAPRDDTLPPGQYRVQRNDTLWEIALKVPDGSGYSPHQTMLAIQDLNPDAFLNNNINRVKAGSVLTLPNESQIAVRSLQEAVAEVQAQNRGDAPRLQNQQNEQGEVQLSATDSTASALPSNDGEKNPDGYLELSADSDSETTSASGDVTEDIGHLQNQLAAAEELNDQYAREREELQARVDELQEQIAIMERLIDVQNGDLAEVQQALSQDETADEAVSSDDVESTVDEFASDDTDSALSDDSMATETEFAADAAMDESVVSEAVVEPVEIEPAPVVEPQPVPEPEKPKGFVAGLLSWLTGSVINMAIVGGGLLLIVLLALFARSRKSSDDDDFADSAEELVSEELSLGMEEDFDDDLLADVEEEVEEEIADEPETLDAVVEAEMYMAYQKYDQAEEKLKEAFSQYPDRADIGLKLLEVYAETGDANAFNDLESRLSLSIDEQQQVSDLRGKLPAGSLDQPGDSFDTDMMAGDLNLDLDVDGLDNEVNLDTALPDELNFDADLDSDEKSVGGDTDLDFDLDLDAIDPIEESSDGESILDLDELNIEGSEQDKAEDAAELDFTLNFDELSEGSADEDESALDLNLGSDTADDLSGDLDFTLDLENELDQAGSDLSLDLEEVPVVSDVEETDLGELDLDSLGTGDSSAFDIAEEADHKTSLVEEGLSLARDEVSLASDDSADVVDLSSVEDLDLDSVGDMDLDVDLSEELSIDQPSADEADSLGELADLDVDQADDDPLQQLVDSLDSDTELDDDDFDFLSGSDEASTKLDLARAYIEMDDKEGARDILEEVLDEGTDEQKAQASSLIEQL
jgi:pilus assembly protein FimV